jgi:hypothetical protein
VPAVVATAWFGSTGASALLVFSQVVLSLQLPFAIAAAAVHHAAQALGELAFGPGWRRCCGAARPGGVAEPVDAARPLTA